MTKILCAALFAMLTACVAVEAPPLAPVAGNPPVLSSPYIAMPAPQEPFDTTVMTPVETAGASRAE